MLGVFLISTRQTPGKGGMIIPKELIRRKQVKGVKIAVIGYSGAGKSTLAKKLGKLFRCPVLHLDRIQFEPGWKERDRETARRMAEDFLDENENRGWIIDGNYTGPVKGSGSDYFYELSPMDLSMAGAGTFSYLQRKNQGRYGRRLY